MGQHLFSNTRILNEKKKQDNIFKIFVLFLNEEAAEERVQIFKESKFKILKYKFHVFAVNKNI